MATDFGTISGDADQTLLPMGGADSSSWAANFDVADDRRPTATSAARSALTARGHDMDGVWAGQFFGNDPTVDHGRMRLLLRRWPLQALMRPTPNEQDANDAYDHVADGSPKPAGLGCRHVREPVTGMRMDDYSLTLLGALRCLDHGAGAGELT